MLKLLICQLFDCNIKNPADFLPYIRGKECLNLIGQFKRLETTVEVPVISVEFYIVRDAIPPIMKHCTHTLAFQVFTCLKM